MVRHVVEKTAFIQVRTYGPRVDVPGACLASDLDAVKALTNIWPFSNGHKPARAVIQLLPADSQHDPVFLMQVADFEVPLLQILKRIVGAMIVMPREMAAADPGSSQGRSSREAAGTGEPALS